MNDQEIKVVADQVWTTLLQTGAGLIDIMGVAIVLLGMVRHQVNANTGRIVAPEGTQQ